jgi:O-Antigen ligase
MHFMTEKDNYIKILLIHFFIGFAVFTFKPLSILYSVAVISIGCLMIIKNKNKNNEVLFWSCYLVGVEVFLRMTKGNIGHEYGKYTLIVFIFLGLFFEGFSKKSRPYWFFLLFLTPGIIIGIATLGVDSNIRKALVFNLLGPIALALSSIYLVGKNINFKDLDKISKYMIYPLIPMLIYLFLYNPSIKDVVTGTDSNSATSGGYGPNQVSTMLGLGMFLAFARLLFFSKDSLGKLINVLLLLTFSFRGLVTFSRGGFITGVVMIVLLLLSTYYYSNFKGKFKILVIVGLTFVIGIIVFTYTVQQTNGLITNRYEGKDALGREKTSKFSGREELAVTEMNLFLENPLLGIGVGRNKEFRKELTGAEAASHNEITRMLAEHGVFGILNLLILLVTPFVLYINNRQHLFFFSFLIFWFFTINHAAMRIAAPAFIYALSLLKVTLIEKPSLHREQIIE